MNITNTTAAITQVITMRPMAHPGMPGASTWTSPRLTGLTDLLFLLASGSKDDEIWVIL
eukprot:gnl/Chilomastix_caulleri/9014.p2 GENE.gnl/Chilomastix_caulleri/9014~~gnl/Chilomastix_caulleri/9014.p2  ORF type:complete len:59 (-),score=15.99 gnl/Chilomastix_caulleri/9014:57-233(-)